MRVLLDECVPRFVKRVFTGHDVRTVQEMGWSSRRNGELMTLIDASGFPVLITVDRSIQHQQDVKRRGFALVVLRGVSYRRADLVPLAERAHALLESLAAGQVQIIESP